MPSLPSAGSPVPHLNKPHWEMPTWQIASLPPPFLTIDCHPPPPIIDCHPPPDLCLQPPSPEGDLLVEDLEVLDSAVNPLEVTAERDLDSRNTHEVCLQPPSPEGDLLVKDLEVVDSAVKPEEVTAESTIDLDMRNTHEGRGTTEAPEELNRNTYNTQSLDGSTKQNVKSSNGEKQILVESMETYIETHGEKGKSQENREQNQIVSNGSSYKTESRKHQGVCEDTRNQLEQTEKILQNEEGEDQKAENTQEALHEQCIREGNEGYHKNKQCQKEDLGTSCTEHTWETAPQPIVHMCDAARHCTARGRPQPTIWNIRKVKPECITQTWEENQIPGIAFQWEQ
ncbi:Hypothetical predicted protein [Pelobates cultripes]|uniref:Uncharacterized protein n=1 Tax=Pelobates cultripes TaxID=61616 RepID=A0AAD1TEP3_PELCU|nr:Hypothetical predicted protein [Pelobates cultripes]